ncbi:MAG: hypothetical protein ACHQFW_04085 [Chitinophagales bacterium]
MMSKPEELFHTIAKSIPGAMESKMFGATCIKAPNGKAVAMIWRDEIVVKLEGDDEKAALKLKGAHVFTPIEGRSMGGWIQIPFAHSKLWLKFAEISMQKVKLIPPKEKKPAKKTTAKKTGRSSPKK